MAKILTIPEAWSHRRDFSQKLKNLYAYATAVMEAWDGPAAICGAHDDWAIAGMDRNEGTTHCEHLDACSSAFCFAKLA